MLKYIGGVLFAIGVFLILPFDEVFVLAPLVVMLGVGVIPVYYAIGLGAFFIGAMLLGIHVIPWFVKHPLGILTMFIAFVIVIYLVMNQGGLFT